MSIIFLLISICAAGISFRYVSFGLCFLLLTKCVIHIPIEISAVNIGIGTLTGSDVVMFVLCIRALFGVFNKQIESRHVLPLILLAISIYISASLAFMFGHGQLVNFYRSSIGLANYYFVIPAMLLITEKEKKFVINFSILISIISIILQSFLIYAKNIELIVAFNPYFKNREAVQLLEYAFTEGRIPRILPIGILLITMCSGYTLVKTFTSSSAIKSIYYSFYMQLLFYFYFQQGQEDLF